MFCKKCGCIIDDDAVFCYKCGTKVFSDKTQVNSQIIESQEPNKNQEILEIQTIEINHENSKTEKCSDEIRKRIIYDSLATKNFVLWGLSGIIDFFFALDIFSKIGNSSYYDNYRLLACFLIVVAIVTLFIGSLKYLNYKKRFVNIYEDYLCGIGPGANDFTNEKFEIQYKDVVKIEKGDVMKTITIHAETTKQTIPVESKEHEEVFELLKVLIREAQNK